MARRPHLLVVNPNTSSAVTATLDALARQVVADAAEIRTVTARFGFRYIASRTAMSVAAHAALDVVADELAHGVRPDVIVLGCFGDPGLDALAEATGLPVVGFAEAGLQAAAALEGRFLVATRGFVWPGILAELALKLGCATRVADIDAIPDSGNDPSAIAAYLSERARTAGAERIVLGGAGLIPQLPAITAASALPVLDPHRAAFAKALRLAGAHSTSTRLAPQAPGDIEGLSPALSRLLTVRAAATDSAR